MQIHSQSRVAIAALLDIASHDTNRPVRLIDVSKRQRVSPSYLDHLFQKLRRKGILASYRGPGGGYRLNRTLATISVADVISAVDGETFDAGSSNGSERNPENRNGIANDLWCRVNDRIDGYLHSMTLESVFAAAMKAADSVEKSTVVATVSCIERAPPKHEDPPGAAA